MAIGRDANLEACGESDADTDIGLDRSLTSIVRDRRLWEKRNGKMHLKKQLKKVFFKRENE